MLDTNKVAIRATTQEHLEIEDVQDNIVILKDGGACVILNVSSINFDLLSEKEQKAMIYAYASLLNSLTFSLLRNDNNALNVAFTWFIGLFDPKFLATTSLTPAISRTART